MSKSIKLKCNSAGKETGFTAGNLYIGRINDDGVIQVKIGKKYHDLDSLGYFIIHALDKIHFAKFTAIKTKTLKCTRVIGSQQKGNFKQGKRYQVESGRALGIVAGYIFDDEGCPWTLYRRDDVGFECSVALFEAKYL